MAAQAAIEARYKEAAAADDAIRARAEEADAIMAAAGRRCVVLCSSMYVDIFYRS